VTWSRTGGARFSRFSRLVLVGVGVALGFDNNANLSGLYERRLS
jgi:hypothetical protein